MNVESMILVCGSLAQSNCTRGCSLGKRHTVSLSYYMYTYILSPGKGFNFWSRHSSSIWRRHSSLAGCPYVFGDVGQMWHGNLACWQDATKTIENRSSPQGS